MDQHVPYADLRGRGPDFVVAYNYMKNDLGQRLFQGMRSDFLYESDDPQRDGIWMIWPEFLDENGIVIRDKGKTIEPSGTAQMWIFDSKLFDFHATRLRPSTTGYLVVGSHKIAKATVTSVSVGGRSS